MLQRDVRRRSGIAPARVEGRGVKYREIIRAVEADGWRLVSQKGSHRQYEHSTKPGKVTISGHPNEDVPRGTLNSIMKQAGLK
jgi:predicted RNA binding protein YcfA (HicA-like mRNA interferase family)